MVELYKDPKGETINTHAKSNEESVAQETDKNGKEIRTLRRRVTELEITLERQVSIETLQKVNFTLLDYMYIDISKFHTNSTNSRQTSKW